MKYPCIEINKKKLIKNVKTIVNLCNKSEIKISGVIKGANALEEVIQCMIDGGVDSIASSRYEQLKKTKEINKNIKTMMIRIPMISEVENIVKYCDYSVNSEIEVLQALNKEAKIQNKIHKVIIMADLGDLREGYIDYNELIETAINVENELNNLALVGIGVNLGCYGSIKPTTENLNKLGEIAKAIESKINRKLEIISGGATSSLTLVNSSTIPKCINHLRIGEGILLNRDLPDFWNCKIKDLHDDTFILKAEIIEKKDKPSYPIGEIFIDAFGNKPEYIDEGIRTKALLGVGNQDLGDYEKIIPIDKRIKIIGASSDHLIADITNAKDYKVGNIIEFKLCYQAMLFLTESNYVAKVFK